MRRVENQTLERGFWKMKKLMSLVLFILLLAGCAGSSNFGIKPGDRIVSALFIANYPFPDPAASNVLAGEVIRQLNEEQAKGVHFEINKVSEVNGSKITFEGRKKGLEIEKTDGGQIFYTGQTEPTGYSSGDYLIPSSQGKQQVAPCDIIIATNRALGGEWRALQVYDYKDGEMILRWRNPETGGLFTQQQWQLVKDDLKITDYVVAPSALRDKLCETNTNNRIMSCGCTGN